MRKYLEIALCVVITFGFIFPIKFVFFPLDIRQIFFVYGFVCLVIKKDFFYLNKKTIESGKHLLIANILLLIVALCSSLANSWYDKYFLTYFLSIAISLISSYGYVLFINIIRKEPLEERTYYVFFILACIVQCLISWFFFFHPENKAFVYNFIQMSEMGADAIERSEGVRFHGLGANFFTGGIAMSIALIFIAFLLRVNVNKVKSFLLAFSAGLIVFIGSNIARTTQIGLLFALFYYVFCSRHNHERFGVKMRKIIPIVIVSIVVVIIYSHISANNDSLKMSSERAFSVFDNFVKNKELVSVTDVNGSFVFPNNLETWFLGDARMADPNNPELAYYMGVDIGVCRVIFCIGVIGMIVFLYLHYNLIKFTGMTQTKVILFFLLFFVLMLKGMPNIINYLAPIGMINIFITTAKHECTRSIPKVD